MDKASHVATKQKSFLQESKSSFIQTTQTEGEPFEASCTLKIEMDQSFKK